MVSEMTSRERVLAMLNGKPVDRVPVVTGSTMVVEYIKKSGGKWPDFHSNPEMMVNVAGMMHTDAGIDSVVVPFGMFVESIALGLDVKMGRVDIQPSVRSFFKKPEEVNYANFLENTYVQTTLEAIKLAKEKYPEAAIAPFLVAPVTLAGDLMGAENLSMLSIKCLQKEKQMAKMEKWLSIALEINKIYAKACIEAGADLLYYSDASASPNLVMPDFYYKVGVPVEKELGDFIHELGCPWVLHICGDTVPIIEGMASTGADCLSVEQAVDMKKATEIVGAVPIAGNLTPLLMVEGTEEQIVNETRKGLNGGAKASMLGCGTPPLSTSDRLKTWVKAAVEWSAENL
ncbi:MAG: uroporphyrinogen decarboxylase family protein [Methanosarcinaceae archaeon]|nr:uroporphyrinogen decarboxylase family protein [Methanosarcinaceae archaeon]MDD4748502.1 uroporphyrinogen decarboxylase family protein [Methanosarcinaceae archaeon]